VRRGDLNVSTQNNQLAEPQITPERAALPLILSLDIGTSSVRALLFDRLGRTVEGMRARATYALHTSAKGAVEADADEILRALWACIDEVVAHAGSLGHHIVGVASCSLVSNVLGIDAEGRAISPVYTYADTRPTPDVETLRAHFNEREVHRRTGCLFHTSYLPARFLWLSRTHPQLLERARRWLSIGEYMEYRLFGEARVSYSVASWTGLLDRNRLQWDKELLSFLPVDEEHLSVLTDVLEPRVGLQAPFAQRWPLLRDVPWFPTVGDGATANVGSGCVTPDRVALTVGTSSAMRVVTQAPVDDVPWGLWCYRVDRRRSLPGGALSEGGNVYAWMKEHLRLPEDLAVLERALATQEPDGHGLTILPFLAGERSPGWHGRARATIHGLTLAHTPVQIMRAGMEAVAYRLGLVFDLLRPLLPPQVEIVASGGALFHSTTWSQIIADVLGHPVTLSRVPEASARGAALLALEALGVLKDVGEAPQFSGTTYEPRSAYYERYRKAMARQQDLYYTLVATDQEERGTVP